VLLLTQQRDRPGDDRTYLESLVPAARCENGPARCVDTAYAFDGGVVLANKAACTGAGVEYAHKVVGAAGE